MRDQVTWTGALNRSWQATLWDLLEVARSRSAEGKEAIEALSRQYWGPVFWELRRRGFSEDQAKDLAQGFFEEVVLGRDLFAAADQSRGRFRSFLKACLRNYVSNQLRRDQRGPDTSNPNLARNLSDEALDGLPDRKVGPDVGFDCDWAARLVAQALENLESSCREDALDPHWEAFRRCVLEPALHGDERPDRSRLAEEIGFGDAKQLANALETVKRRFRSVLRMVVRSEVDSDEAVDAEILGLMDALSSRPAAQLPCDGTESPASPCGSGGGPRA